MVDPIGWKAVTPTGRTSASTPVTVVAPVRIADTTADADTAQITGQAAGQATALSQQLAAEAPVDTDRVSRIKAAIAAGKFPILPSTIADRLLAFKLEWNGNEQA